MRWVLRIAVAIGLLVVVTLASATYLLRGSLAQLDGEIEIAALSAPVQIERDALGVATIRAQTRLDAAYATGYVHAQERFFQMDLQRRVGAGELSVLFGAIAIETDQRYRLHRFRHRARAIVEQLPDDVVALYEAYSDGVNTGLGALRTRPFEYFLLGVRPESWRTEDVLLTTFSMYFELNDEQAQRESALSLLRETLPQQVFDWLVQSGTDWDAPLLGDAILAVPVPTDEVYNLRDFPATSFETLQAVQFSEAVANRAGSNNWVVSPARTADGRAILAGDMHLGHAVPNIWFRARLIVAEDNLDVSGVMLAGTPLVIAGSNGQVAWTFTNSYGDWEDLVLIETHPTDNGLYRTDDGWQSFVEVIERIEVKAAPAIHYAVRETIWGPVIDEDYRGRLRALHWLAHEPQGMNGRISEFEHATTVDEIIAAANQVGAPPQNLMAADAQGHIGWTIMGRIPERIGIEPLTPAAWLNGVGWQGWIHDEAYPRIVDPPEGLLWSANARTVDGDWLQLIGEGNYALGARAGQIRDDLRTAGPLTITQMLEIQLDDRAVFLERWQKLLLRVLDDAADTQKPDRQKLRALVAEWGGRAAVDSAGYRLVRAFRLNVHDAVLSAVLAPVRQQVPDFELSVHGQLERPVWQLVTEQPLHLLSPDYANWDVFLLAIADATVDYFDLSGGELSQHTWGERNTVRIFHPLSRGLPVLSRFLNMPADPLPGDSNMPRVQGPAFGASQRMAVSPGDELNGYLHMPGGQSGHPWSPFYGAGHDDWARGVASPFLPGEPQHRLTLSP